MGRLFGIVVKLLAVIGVASALRPRGQPPGARPSHAGEIGQPTAQRPLAPGWSRPRPDRTPPPTYWPAVFALGITLFAWGIISNLFVLAAGLIIFVVGLAGWIGDLLHDE
ncbi:MAG: hypothetical protein NVSMB65_00140 [Chloroflexota bacterium]